jgi:mannose-6-phosphate isomerase-like protein (cupin superfamily)
MATIVNWRDAQPGIAHDTAIVWSCLFPASFPPQSPGQKAPASVLERLEAITVHGIQGRKQSDHHKHKNREQVYYILAGRGEVLCGDARAPVEEGDALYLPSGLYHQIINQSEDWILHHVISMDTDGDGGQFLKRNWRDVPPGGDGTGAVRWHLLGREGEEGAGCLRGLAFIDREAVQPRSRSAERCEAKLEQVYYILSGAGSLVMDDQTHPVREGDMIHVPAGTRYHLASGDEAWLAYLIIAG